MKPQRDRFDYLPDAIQQISRTVSDAKRKFRLPAEQAKILAGATHDAAAVLDRMSNDNDLWKLLSTQGQLPIASFRLPLTSELFTGLGYDEDRAEELVAEGNRMLKYLATGSVHDPAAAQHSAEAVRQTIRGLAEITRELAEEADAGIEYLEHRQKQVRRLIGFLGQVVQVLFNLVISVAVSAMFTADMPTWAPPILERVDDLRKGLGDGTLALLTFSVAEQGARIATAFGQPAAAALASVRAWYAPSWRPLSATADPRLVRELEELFPNLRDPGLSPTTVHQSTQGRGSARRWEDFTPEEQREAIEALRNDPTAPHRTWLTPAPGGATSEPNTGSMFPRPADSPADRRPSPGQDMSGSPGGRL
jgi:hypothetical protein